jgi:Fic family protein
MSLESRFQKLADKKLLLDQRRPLSVSAVTRLKEYFDVEWTYHSNAIEGSTLTLRETEVVLHQGITVGGKSLREHLEAINHKHAIDFVEALVRQEALLTEHNLRQVHSLILKGIDDDSAGRYRPGQVLISGSTYVPPEAVAVPGLMSDLFAWLNTAALRSPIERAALAHFHLVHIHPFADGNGRTARLLMNLLLLQSGYPLAIIRREDRLAYYDCLDAAHFGQTDPFVTLVVDAVDRSLDIYLSA